MKINILVALFGLIILLACARGKMMNYQTFQEVYMGQNIADVQFMVGRPYEVNDLGDHRQEYIYIERLPMPEGRELFRKFTLVVEHDKVVGKQMHTDHNNPLQQPYWN